MEFLKIKEEKVDNKTILGLMLLAYIFSIAIRMIWVYQFSGMDSFSWSNQIMINTNDGYYFASAVKSLFETGSYKNNPMIEGAFNIYPAVIYITYFFAKILPFSLDTIILYAPAFVSSLIVIPIILLMRLFGYPILGFFSALIASITWSYYNRTMVGYYDSDMFALILPFFILFPLVGFIVKKDIKYIVASSIIILLYPLFYPQGMSVIYPIFIMFIIYTLIFNRKDDIFYQAISILAISLLKISIPLQFLLILAILYLFNNKKIDRKQVMILTAFLLFIFLISVNALGLILSKISWYTVTGGEDHGLKFFLVGQTIREAGKIPFETLANRISGSELLLILSSIGYILLTLRHKKMIIALPLFGIGLFAYIGGLRFTVYAVPIAGISLVYLFYIVTKSIDDIKIRYGAISILVIMALYPNIKHIIEYKVPTVFNNTEVAVLDKLKSISNPKDYTLAWWDYGYPIWYYSNTNTLIDGGKHHHDNFLISEILTTTSQLEAGRLSRIAVEEYIDNNYTTVANSLFKNGKENQLNVNNYLEELKFGDIKLPKKSRDIYLFLPYRMMNILPTVAIFSNRDLHTGKEKQKLLFYKASNFSNKGGIINLGRGMQFNSHNNTIKFGNGQSTKIKYFLTTQIMKNGKTKLNTKLINKSSQISLIYMKSYGSIVVVNDAMLSSTYIRLFVLENYDKNLFELVISNPYAKVYKLKI